MRLKGRCRAKIGTPLYITHDLQKKIGVRHYTCVHAIHAGSQICNIQHLSYKHSYGIFHLLRCSDSANISIRPNKVQWGTSKGIISWVLRVLHECFPLNVFMLHTSALAGRSVDNSRSIPRLLNTPSGVGTSIPS